MVWSKDSQPKPIERAICGFCYMSMGLIGLLYIIITGKSQQSNFFMFHFIQSIILGVMGFLLGWTLNIFADMLGGLAGLAGPGPRDAVSGGIHIIQSLVMLLLTLCGLYGLIFAFLGKIANLPVISNLVRRNLR